MHQFYKLFPGETAAETALQKAPSEIVKQPVSQLPSAGIMQQPVSQLAAAEIFIIPWHVLTRKKNKLKAKTVRKER